MIRHTFYLFQDFPEDQDFAELQLAEGSGRPLGESATGLERVLGRTIPRRASGRKPTAAAAGVQLKLLQ